MWTAEKVKEELPTIPVKSRKSKQTYTGRVSGRNARFAIVWFDGYDGEISAEYNWKQIADQLNTEGGHLIF